MIDGVSYYYSLRRFISANLQPLKIALSRTTLMNKQFDRSLTWVGTFDDGT